MFGFTIIFPYIPTPSFSSSSSSSSSYYYYYYYYYYSYSSSCSRLITQEPTVKSVAPSMAAGKPTAKPSTSIPTYSPSSSSYDIITTFAGGGYGGVDSSVPATSAQLSYPYGVAVDISGKLYIADTFNHKIRVVSSTGIITTLAGGGSGGDGVPATSAQLSYPMGVATDTNGKVYFTDNGNYKIRMVSSTGIITTFAGTGTQGSNGDGGAATSAQLYYPYGVAVDISGKVYIADSGNHKIRMVSSTGIITTIAGTRTEGSNGDGGAATSAQLYWPYGVAVDISGNVYIADCNNNKIRMVSSTGIITTFTGTGTRGRSGDGGTATSAQLYNPIGVAADGNGQRVYIADSGNNKIRLVTRELPIPTNQPAQVSLALMSPYLSSIWRW